MSYFKRKAKDTLVFEVPGCKCYACNDTGIVTNGDGLLTAMVKGYDVDDNGKHHGGTDLAMICWCNAAYNQQGDDGQIIRHGYREDSGAIRKTFNDGQEFAFGVSCPKEVSTEIHKLRKVKWDNTARIMLEKRQQAARGEKPEPTQFMKEARQELQPDTWVQSKVMSSFSSVAQSMFSSIEQGVEAGAHRPDRYNAPEPEPGVELDGVTILTNASDPDDLPF